MKRIEQGYGVRLYLKMINKFKVMGPYFYFYPFRDLTQKSFYGGFHLPIGEDKKFQPPFPIIFFI
jgi:hypothetical protein